ncbi:hypothetical protein [Oribacterium sp. FC2011]|uniref:hypothetical protein n=1 Tax=Oribacterium sp. FC2011 TaxID=1408311 RepID=UPI0004E2679F|nr:hypothetical protein [Oribacterium sp. FC2011]
MKIKKSVFIVLIFSMILLSACGSNKKTKTSSKKQKEVIAKVETEAADEEENEALIGEEALKNALRKRLERCLGIEGASGASLKTLHQSVQLLKLTRDGDYSLNIVTPVVQEFYDSLSADDQKDFLKTWGGIDYYTDTILNDFFSISGMLEDAGDLEIGKEISYDDQMKDKWAIVRQGITGVLPEAVPETEESSKTDESTASDGSIISQETDADGNIILKETDADGNVLLTETDAEGNVVSRETDEGQGAITAGTDENKKTGKTEKQRETDDEDETEGGNRPRNNNRNTNINNPVVVVTETVEETQEETYEEETYEEETEPTVNYPTLGDYSETTAPEFGPTIGAASADTYTNTYSNTYANTSADTFTNVVIVSVDEKLDPAELGGLSSKYDLRLMYDYQNFDKYAFSCDSVSNQEQMDFMMSMLKSENHITSVLQDSSVQLH